MNQAFDPVLLHNVLEIQTIPTLEAIAANSHLRALKRFERDDPPPYVSSTESEELSDSPPPQLGPDGLPEELRALLEQPITDEEIRNTAMHNRNMLGPAGFYLAEAKREDRRVHGYWHSPIFRGDKGGPRSGVIVRHNVKRRWEKLGVWNPKWGLAGRNVDPRDDAGKWRWPWEPEEDPDDPETSRDGRLENAQKILERALRMRQNLRRGENAPVIPRSSLGPDATPSQAESFLISRPWFVYRLEICEESTRLRRLSLRDRARYRLSSRLPVIKRWKERGDWRDEFNQNSVTAWKWRHETPSPEPEDLTPIDEMKERPQDSADMNFTPSEVDDLETIELPKPERPQRFWTIMRSDSTAALSFPGQYLEPAPHAPVAPADVETHLLARSIFGRLVRAHLEPERDSGDPAPAPPGPRRSARIAGMKRPPADESLASQAAPNKRPRRRPPREASPEETKARAKRERGQPRKKSGPGPRPKATKGAAGTAPTRAGAGRGAAAATPDTSETPRRRGRPRKNA